VNLGLGFFGALSSLAIFTSLFDPFSAAKTFVIVTSAFLLAGYGSLELIKSRGITRNSLRLGFIALAFLFALLLLIRALSSSDMNLALYGVVGRNSGFYTYLGYVILFVVAITFVRSNHFNLIVRSLLVAGFLAGFYSLLESFDANPWKMRGPYEGTSGLFGNPNFSGAFLSLAAVTSLWVLISKFSVKEKYGAGVTLALSLYGVYTAKALQGYLSVAIGVSVIALVWLFARKKSLGFVGLVLIALAGLIAMAGMLQKGPLSSLLYKGSVSERGDMWRTAISMIKDQPLWGVGLERYGMFFRQYRDIEHVKRTGVDSFSDNAHNVLLHLTATGGVFIGLIFALLTILVLVVGIRGLMKTDGIRRSYLTFALAIWIPIQAQNTISVDTPGVFVWSWILGGAIVALSTESQDVVPEKSEVSAKVAVHPLAPAIALVAVLLGMGLMIKPMLAQKDFKFAFYLGVDEKFPESLTNKVTYLINAENQDPGNVTWSRYSANSLFIDKAWKESIAAAERAVKKDPQDWVSWWFMASAYEESGDRVAAIPARMKTVELDPLNTSVLLELAKNQLAAGDQAGFEKSKARILEIDPNGSDAKAVAAL
jgi:O-antigen ligase